MIIYPLHPHLLFKFKWLLPNKEIHIQFNEVFLLSVFQMNLNNDKTMLEYLGVQVLTSDSDITDIITSADLLEEQEDNPNNPIEPNPKKCNVCYKEFTEKCNLSRQIHINTYSW